MPDQLMGDAMSTITEHHDYLARWCGAIQSVEAFLVGVIQQDCPDAGLSNDGFEEVRCAIANMRDHEAQIRKVLADLEAEEPGEDMRREHGTYFCSNGLRAG